MVPSSLIILACVKLTGKNLYFHSQLISLFTEGKLAFVVCLFFIFVFFIFCKTGFLCVTLSVLEATLQTRLALK